MANSSPQPEQPGEEVTEGQVIDPRTGKRIRYADLRSEFERLSQQVPRDSNAERAFIQSKIEMIRHDPHLSDEEKKRAIADLERGLHP